MSQCSSASSERSFVISSSLSNHCQARQEEFEENLEENTIISNSVDLFSSSTTLSASSRDDEDTDDDTENDLDNDSSSTTASSSIAIPSSPKNCYQDNLMGPFSFPPKTNIRHHEQQHRHRRSFMNAASDNRNTTITHALNHRPFIHTHRNRPSRILVFDEYNNGDQGQA
ncbi:predicted protein [Naegleria gruberi]|uniref:Predicted protein n=1 Tax=Naegleria gruberi TaxID=5762 RepID=D2V119_NAEGR|nr:uncharacterized protein NAEGRDRAFT_62494 [Naegleria gruberi]EFC49611.1 predicted protein [Naegleria gruberi]|eukprot:XP_002682355.1 predicted protein [Naegleria gruberi strain NEG-M]